MGSKIVFELPPASEILKNELLERLYWLRSARLYGRRKPFFVQIILRGLAQSLKVQGVSVSKFRCQSPNARVGFFRDDYDATLRSKF
jgi:hypothetical protein